MDPAFLTIAELNRLYDQRELSPVEVTRSLLDRIAAHDGRLHSFIRVTPELALAEAAAAERELMAGRRRGPLHGIPYALKDIVETDGIPTTGHSKLCQDYVPTADAHLVSLLKAGGAEDIALLLQVIAGFDPEDPGSENAPVPHYAALLAGSIQGVRLGLVEHWYAEGAHPDLAPAMSAAVEVLRGLGAIVEPVQLSSLRDYTDCKTTISIAELYAIHEQDLKTRPQDFGRILRNRVLPGALIRAEDYVQALRWRGVLAREQAMALRRFDALLTAGALNIADRADPNQPDRLVSSPSITM